MLYLTLLALEYTVNTLCTSPFPFFLLVFRSVNYICFAFRSRLLALTLEVAVSAAAAASEIPPAAAALALTL